MLRAVSYLPLALLFLASAVPSNGQMRRSEADGIDREVTVKLGAPLTVECPLRPEQVAEWKRNGGDIPRDMRILETPDKTSPDALTARLTAPEAMAHHAGVYTCAKASPRIKVKVTDTETTTLPVEAAKSGADFNGEVKYFEVRAPNFELDCDIGGNISWQKNGTALESLEPALRNRIVLKPYKGVENAQLTITGRATEDDHGNYTCMNTAGNQRSWTVKARPHAKLPTDSNVVEGQKLKLTCKIIGRPYPRVQWTYSNTSELVVNGTEAAEYFGDRVQLVKSDQGVENGDLIIESSLRADAGWYKCTPEADAKANATTAITRLRVKDMYAALWPFLGICAEVFILCAIILVYEKRRTKPELDDSDTDNHDHFVYEKRRTKPELDDSDTDNHDQKKS